MKLKNPSLLILAASFLITGCAMHKKPNVPKVNQTAYLLVPGCDGGQKIKDVPGPLKDYRQNMLDRYGFFMDSEGYNGERKIFEQCDSVEAIDRYMAQFWGPVRDTDTTTPVNEYRVTIDQRIEEIENEILFQDQYVPGTMFRNSGGLRGDMAHVYLLKGEPHYKVRVTNSHLLADLMAWVYFDPNQRPLFVFLFYNNGFGYRLFRDHMVINSYEAYMDILKKLARSYPTTEDDFIRLDQELARVDQEGIFRFAIQRFSYYEEVKLDKVIAPPRPEVITAKALQPKILGVPDIPKDMNVAFNGYSAITVGFFRLNKVVDGDYSSSFVIKHSDIDWEVKGEKVEASFDLLLSFTDEKTRNKKEFYSRLHFYNSLENYKANKDNYFIANLDKFPDQDGVTTIPSLIKGLEPGDYEVKVRFINLRTLKSGIWFEYITVVK